MNDPIKKFFNKAQKVSLSSEEKKQIKAKIMGEMGLPSEVERKNSHFHRVFVWQHFFSRQAFAVAFVAVIFLGGGTAALAEQAFPGDVLYPVKTQITEEIRGWFLRSPREVNEWQLLLAKRRLKEVQYISNTNDISPALREKVRDELEEKISQIEKNIQVSAMSDVRVTTMIVDKTSQNNENGAVMISESSFSSTKVRSDSKSKSEASVEVKQSIESTSQIKIGASSEIERNFSQKIEMLENEIKEIKEEISSLKSERRLNMEDHIEGRLILAEKALLDAQINLSKKNEIKVDNFIQKSESMLREIENLLNSGSHYNERKIDIEDDVNDFKEEIDKRIEEKIKTVDELRENILSQ